MTSQALFFPESTLGDASKNSRIRVKEKIRYYKILITRKVGRTLQSWLFVSIVALVFSFIYRILALISLKNEAHNSQIEIIEETQADISAVTASTAV